MLRYTIAAAAVAVMLASTPGPAVAADAPSLAQAQAAAARHAMRAGRLKVKLEQVTEMVLKLQAELEQTEKALAEAEREATQQSMLVVWWRKQASGAEGSRRACVRLWEAAEQKLKRCR